MRINNKKGISLIVLVITIIVIIILAVAVILSLANNNPIENAREARNANDEATLKEAATVAYADWYTKSQLDSDFKTANPKSQTYVKNVLKNQGFTEEEMETLAVGQDGTILTETPVIPDGFEYVTGTVDTGMVIKNSTDGNEFVWVPVNTTNTSLQINNLTASEVDPNNTYGEKDIETAMKQSVAEYGGFYVGRYETSINAEGTACSIGNVNSNAGDWETLFTKQKALYAESDSVVSSMIYDCQWRAVMDWMKDVPNPTGIDSQKYVEDSFGMGHFCFAPCSNCNGEGCDNCNGNAEDGMISTTESYINTGSNEKYKVNNIYDLAGNNSEWTCEYSQGTEVYEASNGGDACYQGTYSWAARDTLYLGTGTSSRLQLFIKVTE